MLLTLGDATIILDRFMGDQSACPGGVRRQPSSTLPLAVSMLCPTLRGRLATAIRGNDPHLTLPALHDNRRGGVFTRFQMAVDPDHRLTITTGNDAVQCNSLGRRFDHLFLFDLRLILRACCLATSILARCSGVKNKRPSALGAAIVGEYWFLPEPAKWAQARQEGEWWQFSRCFLLFAFGQGNPVYRAIGLEIGLHLCLHRAGWPTVLQ